MQTKILGSLMAVVFALLLAGCATKITDSNNIGEKLKPMFPQHGNQEKAITETYKHFIRDAEGNVIESYSMQSDNAATTDRKDRENARAAWTEVGVAKFTQPTVVVNPSGNGNNHVNGYGGNYGVFHPGSGGFSMPDGSGGSWRSN